MHHVQGTAISNELKPLTGIRGFAAFMVVMFHFQGFSILFPTLGTLDPLWKVGGLGVDLFFILSGFILAYVYSSGEGTLGLKPYLKFLWFRFARLYPNHFATLLALCLLVVSAKIFGQSLTGNYPSGSLPHQLTMLHAWPYAPGSDGSQWNFPSWSISAEWFAYVFIFPLAWYLRRSRFLDHQPLQYPPDESETTQALHHRVQGPGRRAARHRQARPTGRR